MVLAARCCSACASAIFASLSNKWFFKNDGPGRSEDMRICIWYLRCAYFRWSSPNPPRDAQAEPRLVATAFRSREASKVNQQRNYTRCRLHCPYRADDRNRRTVSVVLTERRQIYWVHAQCCGGRSHHWFEYRTGPETTYTNTIPSLYQRKT